MITARSMDPDRLVDIVRRLSMLEAIRRDTLRREELQRRLEISKNTYYRHLNRLSEGRLIEESDDGIALTPAGEVVVEEVDRFEGVVLTALGNPRRIANSSSISSDTPGDSTPSRTARATAGNSKATWTSRRPPATGSPGRSRNGD